MAEAEVRVKAACTLPRLHPSSLATTLAATLGDNVVRVPAHLRRRVTEALCMANAVAATLVPAGAAAEAASVAVELASNGAEVVVAPADVAEPERLLAPLRQRDAAAEQELEQVRVALRDSEVERKQVQVKYAHLAHQRRKREALSGVSTNDFRDRRGPPGGKWSASLKNTLESVHLV